MPDDFNKLWTLWTNLIPTTALGRNSYIIINYKYNFNYNYYQDGITKVALAKIFGQPAGTPNFATREKRVSFDRCSKIIKQRPPPLRELQYQEATRETCATCWSNPRPAPSLSIIPRFSHPIIFQKYSVDEISGWQITRPQFLPVHTAVSMKTREKQRAARGGWEK